MKRRNMTMRARVRTLARKAHLQRMIRAKRRSLGGEVTDMAIMDSGLEDHIDVCCSPESDDRISQK